MSALFAESLPQCLPGMTPEVAQQSALDFPESLTEAYKPRTLGEFCGLEKQKKILAAFAAKPRPATILLEGDTGTGKTSACYAFARTIGAEIHHLGSQESTIENVKRVVSMCHYVPMSGGFHAVVIDEVDRSSSAVQLYLLSKFDGTEPVPATIFLLTANSTDTLEERFLSRCIRLPRFNTYGAGESIRALLSRIWKERAGDAPEPDYSRVPTGSVRAALNWLECELLSI